MRSFWICAALVGGVALLSLSACSDSTDVGLGVGPTPGGESPRTLNVIPELDTTQKIPQTGRVVASLAPGGGPSWRFLVGRVNDPIPGTGVIEAESYFDVSLPATLPDRIAEESDPDSIEAQLRLPRTYLHGDSTNAVNIEVLNLTADPNVAQARADTTFDDIDGSSATTAPVEVPLADTMVINLPSSWLTSERLDDLRKEDTESDSLDQVRGFKLTSPITEDVVVGFSTSSATLRLRHKAARDSITADYTSFKSFTHIEQVGTPDFDSDPLSSSHQLIQDGTGIGLEMTWDFNGPPLDTLRKDPLNGAQIFVPVDTTKMQEEYSPSGFARPLPNGYRIFAVQPLQEDSPLQLIPSAAPAAAQVTNNLSFSIVRESLRRADADEDPVFDALQTFVADRQSAPADPGATVNPGLPSTLPALVPTDESPLEAPRLTLTVTPL